MGSAMHLQDLPAARTPRRTLRFGRAALLAGWVVFALATTLSTCIDAIAASDDHALNVTVASPDKLANHSLGETLFTEHADDGSSSSCCHVSAATPRNVDDPPALPTSKPPALWPAFAAASAAFPALAPPPAHNFTQHDAPPFPRRLYLRTLHLLI
jgi:hypothetical protein